MNQPLNQPASQPALDLIPVVPVPEILAEPKPLVAAMATIGSLVKLRPESEALALNGLRAQSLIDTVSLDIEIAQTLTVDSADLLHEAESIAGRLAAVFAGSGALENERKALTAPFNDLVKALNAGYGRPIEFGAAVLTDLKGKMLRYTAEQQRLARLREEEERQERERKAAEAAQAEQRAQEQANELLARAQEAQAGGAEVMAEVLATEATVLVDVARAGAQAAAAALQTRVVSVRPVAAKGARVRYKGEVLDKAKAIAHIGAMVAAGDHSLLHLVDIDASALNKQADMQREAFKVPGLHAYPEQSVSVRKAALV